MQKKELIVANFSYGFMIGYKDQDALYHYFEDDIPETVKAGDLSLKGWSTFSISYAMYSYKWMKESVSDRLNEWYNENINNLESGIDESEGFCSM